MIDPSRSIFTFDRDYNALELFTRIIEMRSYFVVRLKNNTYKKEKSKITSPDSPIQIKLKNKIKNFKDPELKAKYADITELELRLIKIQLENGEIETLLTNIPKEIMKLSEIKYIYKKKMEN